VGVAIEVGEEVMREAIYQTGWWWCSAGVVEIGCIGKERVFLLANEVHWKRIVSWR